MGSPEELQSKIGENDLLAFAESDSDESRTVIVALDVPMPQVKFRETIRGGRVVHLPSEVMPESDEAVMQVRRLGAEARDFFEGELHVPARFLPSAESFVVTVSPSQIRAIASRSFTRAIHSNELRT